MPRLARERQPKTARSRETEQPRSVRPGSPREDHDSSAADRAPQVARIRGANWIVDFTERSRVRRSVGKEVHDFDAAEAPRARESDAAADRRIGRDRVRRRRVEHHESDDRLGPIPPPPEPIAVSAVGAERGAPKHGDRAASVNGVAMERAEWERLYPARGEQTGPGQSGRPF